MIEFLIVVVIAVIIALFCCLFFYLGRYYELRELAEEYRKLEGGAE